MPPCWTTASLFTAARLRYYSNHPLQLSEPFRKEENHLHRRDAPPGTRAPGSQSSALPEGAVIPPLTGLVLSQQFQDRALCPISSPRQPSPCLKARGGSLCHPALDFRLNQQLSLCSSLDARLAQLLSYGLSLFGSYLLFLSFFCYWNKTNEI